MAFFHASLHFNRLIPFDFGHRFRFNPDRHSGPFRTPIPIGLKTVRVHFGIPVRITPELLSEFNRKHCPNCIGTPVRRAPEYARTEGGMAETGKRTASWPMAAHGGDLVIPQTEGLRLVRLAMGRMDPYGGPCIAATPGASCSANNGANHMRVSPGRG